MQAQHSRIVCLSGTVVKATDL